MRPVAPAKVLEATGQKISAKIKIMERLKVRTVAKVVGNTSGHDAPIGKNVFIHSYVSDVHYQVIDRNLCIWNMERSELEPVNQSMKIEKNLGKPKK